MIIIFTTDSNVSQRVRLIDISFDHVGHSLLRFFVPSIFAIILKEALQKPKRAIDSDIRLVFSRISEKTEIG